MHLYVSSLVFQPGSALDPLGHTSEMLFLKKWKKRLVDKEYVRITLVIVGFVGWPKEAQHRNLQVRALQLKNLDRYPPICFREPLSFRSMIRRFRVCCFFSF